MANDKSLTNQLVTGGIIGTGLFGVVAAIKKIQEDRRMRKQLAKLEDTTEKELAKDDISISGDFFKDKYQPYTKQAGTVGAVGAKKSEGLDWLPGAAMLLSGVGLGYAGTNIISELLSRKKPAQTPQFAIDYKNKRKEEFERAARLLRAVTDAPTWKDVAREEKMASLKTAESMSEGLGSGLGREVAPKLEPAADSVKSFFDSLKDAMNNYAFPALGAAGIVGAGYVGYKGLNKLLHAIRKYKNKSTSDDAAINAWLAQRKDLGEAGKALNTYIETDDSAERKELNKLLAAYESRYKK